MRVRCRRYAALPFLLMAVSGCADFAGNDAARVSPRPSVTPLARPTASLQVDASQIRPMYDRRMFAVDLPTVVRVAMARNIDIKESQQRIEASRGALEANVGMIFPSVTPNVTALGIRGAVSTPAGFTVQSFNHIFPLTAAVQWVINPGQVVYDIIASKRRLNASEEQDEAVILETTRVAAVQYYDVVLAQAQVAVARRAIQEGEELLRIERVRFMAGTGLPADSLRAEAALSARQQNFLAALNGFYNASVALTVTLHLDPTVMLVPKAGSMRDIMLVRENIPIDDMLVTAVYYRPDLRAVRDLVAAADADTGSTIWGGLGPQVAAARVFGPKPPAHILPDTEYRQPQYIASGGFNWSLATFGRIKTAAANAKIAGLNLDRELDLVQSAVVTAHQASITAKQIIPVAQKEINSSEEALRLTQENRENGTGLTIDVLLAQDTADQARLHYATAVVRYNQAEVNLLAALGILDPSNVPGRTRREPATRP